MSGCFLLPCKELQRVEPLHATNQLLESPVYKIEFFLFILCLLLFRLPFFFYYCNLKRKFPQLHKRTGVAKWKARKHLYWSSWWAAAQRVREHWVRYWSCHRSVGHTGIIPLHCYVKALHGQSGRWSPLLTALHFQEKLFIIHNCL